jgi:spore germination protein KA
VSDKTNDKSFDIKAKEEALTKRFEASFDIKVESYKTVKGEVLVFYVDGLISRDLLHRDVIRPLRSPSFNGNIADTITCSILYPKDEAEFEHLVFNGHAGIIYNGEFLISDIKMLERRGIQPPDAENVTRGPKDAFTEDIVVNSSLVRRRIKNPNLVLKRISLGHQTNTTVLIVYIDGIVNKDVLERVEARLKKIEIDSVLETGVIEQLIEKKSLTPLSGIGMTQKPDIACRRILEGRVAVFVEGTPHVLTIPELFVENLQSPEDYSNRTLLSSMFRVLRFIALFVTVLLPGLTVAIVCFHREMIPLGLLETFIANSATTPMPFAIEIFFTLIIVEFLKESGVRLPRGIGMAVAMIGGLLVGEAMLISGIMGAPSIIILGLTTVCSFIVFSLHEFSTVYRFVFLFLGATFGIVGIGAGLLIMLAQLAAVNPFGVRILTLFDDDQFLKDSLVRFPLRKLTLRPKALAKENVTRLKNE